GGVSFLVGWALFLIGAIRLKRKGASHEFSCIALPSGV
ncbi:hypothetical protein ACSMCR_24590, partial [Salmonella enterica]